MGARTRLVPITGVLAASTALLAGCGSPPTAVSSQDTVTAAGGTGKTMHLFSQVKPDGKASVLVTGAIGDYGRSFPANSKGKANSNDNYEEVVLKHGSFLLDERKLNDVRPTGGSTRATCSSTYTFKAKVPISLGTGAYAGIHGSLNAVAILATVSPRHTSGPDKGQCNDQVEPKPPAFVASVTGQGKVVVPTD
jgi:hypothetical protein